MLYLCLPYKWKTTKRFVTIDIFISEKVSLKKAVRENFF
jgi:hypothetical protein